MQSQGWTWQIERSLVSDAETICHVIHEVIGRLQLDGWSECDVFGVHLALEEALCNAMKHGNNNDPSKRVDFVCKLGPGRLWAEVRDEGGGFDPAAVPDPTTDDRLELPSGRGLLLMRRYMTRVEYNSCGNGVVLEKHCHGRHDTN